MTNLRSIVCDLDGVLYLGSETVPGAGRTLETLESAGIDLWFVTNNSTKTPEEVAAKIVLRTGYQARPERVVTSALAAADLLAGTVSSALVLGEPGLRTALTDAGITAIDASDVPGPGPAEVDAVVVGLDYGFTYQRLAAASMAVRAGARLVGSNGDATFPTPHGQAPGAGSMVAAVEKASGVVAELCGKPHPAMRRLLASRLADGPVLVVGDRIDTDLELGWAEGWATALVLTGVGRTGDTGAGKIDHVLPSIAELPAALGL